MRIVIATGIYPPEIGGPATHTVLMEQEMPKFGHSVFVVPFAPSRKYPKIIRHIHYFFRVCKALIKADVLFAQDVLSVGLPSMMAAFLLGKKFVVRVPGDYAWEQSSQRFDVKDSIDDFQTKHYSMQVELLRFLQTLVVKRANHVVTPSDYFNRLVCGWGVKTEKVTTIYNGVALDIETKLITKPHSPLAVSVGRLVPWKGFTQLIDAIKELPEWHLYIIGSGPDQTELQKQIESLGLTERVKLMGSLGRNEVMSWCKSADAFVLNTHFESFSYQIVEALSVGVPVIATNVGSIPELIEHDKEGILLSPDDVEGIRLALRSVISEPSVWKERKERAQAKVKKFDVATTSESLDKLLRLTVSKK